MLSFCKDRDFSFLPRWAMRVLLAITILYSVACCARGDEGLSDAPDPIPWQNPFETISASKADESLVLILITNEDPFVASERAKKTKKQVRADQGTSNPPVWCANVLALSYRKAIEQRGDLRERLTLQSIAAGLPKELTGGDSRNAPARAVLALCDGNYRLLAFMVGVPDVDDLLTLIEDGEDVVAIGQLDSEHPQQIVHKIAQRSSERMSRLWRGSLEEMAVAMQSDEDGVAESKELLNARLRLLSETFEPTYLADVRLRFGLTESTDQTRLIVLEQHPETRRPWCESMIPFIAGSDFLETWGVLVESIWGHQPISHDAEAEDLLSWFDLQTNTDSVVLSLQPPLHLQRLPWPPITEKGGRKRGVGWQDVHALAVEHPFRSVDAQQLAVLIRARDLNAVDIHRPSMARYLFLEPKRKRAIVVREADPPGRFAGILKRTQSSLVTE